MSDKPFWSAYKYLSLDDIENIQEVTISQGRQNVTDNYRAGTCVIRGRRPDLLPTLALGDQVNITCHAGGSSNPSLDTVKAYRVSDLRIDYGVTSEYDTFELELEDALGIAGRALVDVSWAAGTNTSDAFDAVCTALGVTYTPSTSYHYCNAQNISNENALDILQTIVNTEQGMIGEVGVDFINFLLFGWPYYSTVRNWTDDGTGSFPVSYDSLTFRGLADNYADLTANQVRGGSTYTAGSGTFSFQYDTYSNTAGEAQGNAEYLLGLLNLTENVPFSISTKLDIQPVTSRSGTLLITGVPGTLDITFRGTIYSVFVIGSQVTGTVDQTRVTHYLAARESLTGLILDNLTGLGRLDYNRLGF